MTNNRAFVSRFSPNRTAPEVLEAIFVQRHRLAEVWLERLRDSVFTKVKHHLLAVGPRGCGKSHLVALLVSRLRKDPAVRDRVRIAWLPEDESTPSFWKFLLRILRALYEQYEDEFPPPPRKEIAAATDDRRSAMLTDYLLKKLDGRVLLVVVENLDDVMQGLKVEGQKRWRAFLQEHQVTATLATAQRLTKNISDRDRPFFNFFQIEHLQPLSTDDALLLLQKIAEHNKNSSLRAFLQTATGRARVRAIRHLTGGSHRVFIILSEFATRENLDDLVTAFEELLDELTPYYQERLRWLRAEQQREIVEFLCRQTRTVTVKEIAGELFLSEQTAAAQLKQLKDKGYVTAGSVGRESRYELAEPLMRLCVEVKDPQREPIRLVVEFLRVWYDRAGVKARLQCLPANADMERRYFRAALKAYRPNIPGPIEAALDRDLEAARATGDPEEVVRVLVELAATSNTVERTLKAGYELTDLGRYAEALAAYDRTIELDPENDVAWHNKGYVLHKLGRNDEALDAYNRATEIEPEDAITWDNKGYVLHKLGRYDEALAACDVATEIEPEDAIYWVNKGEVLNELEKYAESLDAYDWAIVLNPEIVEAWIGKGYELNELGRHREALAAFDRALELDPKFADAWKNKGWTLNELGRYAEALTACDRATELDPKDANAWHGKGWTLDELGRYAEALTAYDRATELDPKDATAWSNKGYTLNKLGRSAEALVSYDRAIELDPAYAIAWDNRGRAKLGLGQISEAMDDFSHAAELNPHSPEALEGLAETHVLQGNWGEAVQVLSDRFRLPPSSLSSPKDSHLPDLITAIFRASTDRRVWTHRVGRLAEIASNAQLDWEQKNASSPGATATVPVPPRPLAVGPIGAGPIGVLSATLPVPPRPLAVLGDSLVRSLKNLAYADAPAVALDTWTEVWREVAERHPDLSLATRLFGVGVRYLRTKDERVLLDLVQEERLILSDLFGLDEGTDKA